MSNEWSAPYWAGGFRDRWRFGESVVTNPRYKQTFKKWVSGLIIRSRGQRCLGNRRGKGKKCYLSGEGRNKVKIITLKRDKKINSLLRTNFGLFFFFIIFGKKIRSILVLRPQKLKLYIIFTFVPICIYCQTLLINKR